jgi:hypothetical protein
MQPMAPIIRQHLWQRQVFLTIPGRPTRSTLLRRRAMAQRLSAYLLLGGLGAANGIAEVVLVGTKAGV